MEQDRCDCQAQEKQRDEDERSDRAQSATASPFFVHWNRRGVLAALLLEVVNCCATAERSYILSLLFVLGISLTFLADLLFG